MGNDPSAKYRYTRVPNVNLPRLFASNPHESPGYLFCRLSKVQPRILFFGLLPFLYGQRRCVSALPEACVAEVLGGVWLPPSGPGRPPAGQHVAAVAGRQDSMNSGNFPARRGLSYRKVKEFPRIPS